MGRVAIRVRPRPETASPADRLRARQPVRPSDLRGRGMRRPRRQGEGLTASCGRGASRGSRAQRLDQGHALSWLKNLQNLDEEEKASIVRLEAANLDAMQAWQIRQNLQDLFAMPSVASARRFLHRWYAWVSTCDPPPMKKPRTIMAKADEILRSAATSPAASWKPSTATSRPPNARPRTIEPNATSN